MTKSCKRPTIRDLIERANQISPENIDFSNPEKVKKSYSELFSLFASTLQITLRYQEENKLLKDEINRLKGEKGRPDIKPNVPNRENDPPKNNKPKTWKKRSKINNIKISRKITLHVDKNMLPDDAVFKGYENVTVQEIKIVTDNIMFRKEIWYSKSQKRTIKGEVPSEYSGSEFGPKLRAFAYQLYYDNNVTSPQIHRLLSTLGFHISRGHISNMLTKDNKNEFSREKHDAYKEGMKHSMDFGTDDTGWRHAGKNIKMHAVTTAFMTSFFIMTSKNRETIEYILNLSNANWKKMVMISDDARQFWGLTSVHALCWIHEIRHYRKLYPLLDCYTDELRRFISDVWKFYHDLDDYRKDPNPTLKPVLEKKFDDLFTSESSYAELDWRKKRTIEHKSKLLVALDYPFVPLHNNGTESVIRIPVRKRDISPGTRSDAGKEAMETMLSLKDTCRKLDVNFMNYIEDRFSKRNEIPELAEIIRAKVSECS